MVEKDSYIRPQVIGTKGVLEFNHTLVKYQPGRSFFVLLKIPSCDVFELQFSLLYINHAR